MNKVPFVLFLLASMVFRETNAQDSLKHQLLGKRWHLHKEIRGNDTVDVAESNKKHYILLKKKIIETLGPNGEILESPYTMDEQTRVISITMGSQKMKIVSVKGDEMIFYFLTDPEKKYVTIRRKPEPEN